MRMPHLVGLRRYNFKDEDGNQVEDYFRGEKMANQQLSLIQFWTWRLGDESIKH
jgi:hypothetical protein